MIITTPRTCLRFIAETAATTALWLGFAYLIADTIEPWVSSTAATLNLETGNLSSIGSYLNELLLFPGAVLMTSAAATWHIRRHRKYGEYRDLAPTPNPLNDVILADHFHLSNDDLRHVHDSRITVIHLTGTGEIYRLEHPGTTGWSSPNHRTPLAA
jgi:hypothetical protein